MLDQGLTYFMPYESFTFPELLVSIALRHNPQGYIIKAYKEQNKGEEESKYQLDIFLEYFLGAIINAFMMLADWIVHRLKTQIDIKKEKVNFYQNEDEMIDWIDERYSRNTTKLLQS